MRPAALLLNYRSVIYTFVPDAAGRRGSRGGRAAAGRHGGRPQRAAGRRPLRRLARCAQGQLRARSHPLRRRPTPRPAASSTWPVADPQPATYDARLIEALWREMGGRLRGTRARRRRPCATLPPSLRVAFAAAGRGGARHQQVQQQPDGAAAVPDPGAAGGAAAAGHAGGRAPALTLGHGWPARPNRRPAGGRASACPPSVRRRELFLDNGSGLSRTRASAPSAGAAAAAGLRQPGDERVHVVAADHGPGRHAAPLARHARPRAPEDGLAARRGTASPATCFPTAAAASCWWPSSTTRRRAPHGRRSTRWCSGRCATHPAR